MTVEVFDVIGDSSGISAHVRFIDDETRQVILEEAFYGSDWPEIEKKVVRKYHMILDVKKDIEGKVGIYEIDVTNNRLRKIEGEGK